MARFLLILAAAAAFCVASQRTGAQEPPPKPASEAPKQVYCPVTPEEEIDPEVFTDYQGKRVYFCCDKCKARFLRDPERFATRLIRIGAPAEPVPPSQLKPELHQPKPPETPTMAATDHADAAHQHGEASAGAKPTEHEQHAHGHEHGPRWVNYLGRFHPAMTNFPIGVLIAGAVAELLFRLSRRPIHFQTARFCVWFAVLTGVMTGLLGWCFGGFHLVDSDWLLRTHRWIGTATVLWMLGLLWASELAHREQPRAVALYLFLLFGGSLLVTVTGFFGGAMVYGLDHYAWH